MSSNQIISKCYIVKFLYFISSNYIKSIVLQLSTDLYILKRFIVFLPSHLTYLFLALSLYYFFSPPFANLSSSLFFSWRPLPSRSLSIPFLLLFLGFFPSRPLSPSCFSSFFIGFFILKETEQLEKNTISSIPGKIRRPKTELNHVTVCTGML